MSSTGTTTRGPLAVIGWAAYLACSWTWCIGMFLPVLLLRDYGTIGFVIFAVPNVIGAAAMGWVLRRPGAAEELLRAHTPAVLAFSAVTITFQLFFLRWLGGLNLGSGVGSASIARWMWPVVAAALVLSIVAAMSGRRRWLGSIGVWALSAACAVYLFFGGGLGAGVEAPPVQIGGAVLFLAPVCLFGFALCPYLDATFLTARRSLQGSEGTSAFVLGFGVLFAAMIAFTYGYAAMFGGTDTLPGLPSAQGALVSVLVLHIAAQVIFTVAVHVGAWGVEFSSADSRAMPRRFLLLIVVPIIVSRLAAASGGGEVVYRCFMSFYGLVFPAYVWLCMIPTPDGHSGTSGSTGRRKLVVLAAAVSLAAPFYWMGFIAREEFWLAPGLGAVLLLRLVVRRMARGGAAQAAVDSAPA